MVLNDLLQQFRKNCNCIYSVSHKQINKLVYYLFLNNNCSLNIYSTTISIITNIWLSFWIQYYCLVLTNECRHSVFHTVPLQATRGLDGSWIMQQLEQRLFPCSIDSPLVQWNIPWVWHFVIFSQTKLWVFKKEGMIIAAPEETAPNLLGIVAG